MARLLNRTIAVALVAGLAGVLAYVTIVPAVQKQAGGGRRAKMLADMPVPVLDAAARVSDVPVFLSGVGTAKARNTVTVRAQVDGRILAIKFKEGQEVKRGDVLALIDPATYQAQLDQATAKRALDEAQLTNAQRDLERYVKLPNNVVAQKTVDTQRALVAQFTAQIKLDDAAIANARAYLDYTTIVAPLDGRTGIRMVDEGNLVRGSDANAGIVVITEVRPISVLFTLPQQQLAQVNAAAAKAPLAVDALDADGRTVIERGALQVVDNQVDQTTGTVRMKAEFANNHQQLWPGQFVNVRVLVDTLQNVVVVPTPAVQRGPSGTFAYVVRPDDTVGLRPITVGLQTENFAVISKGIEATDRVVTTGFARLKDGARIVVTPPEDDTPGNADKQRPVAAAKPEGGASESGRGGGVRTACADDLQKHCANVERSREAMRACLAANAQRLSQACKAAVNRPPREGGASKPREADARKTDGSATQ